MWPSVLGFFKKKNVIILVVLLSNLLTFFGHHKVTWVNIIWLALVNLVAYGFYKGERFAKWIFVVLIDLSGAATIYVVSSMIKLHGLGFLSILFLFIGLYFIYSSLIIIKNY